jgi:hypothetical protein
MSRRGYKVDGIPYDLTVGVDLPVTPPNLR